MQNTRKSPKTVLCIHDLASVGRSSLAVIAPALAAMGLQPIQLPTQVLSSHTGGFGSPVRLSGGGYGQAALEHFQSIGMQFDCIYSGYLGNMNQVELVKAACVLWPDACKVVDPVMGDHGKAYSGIYPDLIRAMKELCQGADLILPNLTEAGLLLGEEIKQSCFSAAEASVLVCRLTKIAPNVVVTGIPMGKLIGCAGAGQEDFVVQKPLLPRIFPGTGDLFGAVTIGGLLRGNVLSAAVDFSAAFVARCIESTPPEADTRFGVWLEPCLGGLIPQD